MFAPWLQRCCQLCSRHKSAFPGDDQNMFTWPLQMGFYYLCLSLWNLSDNVNTSRIKMIVREVKTSSIHKKLGLFAQGWTSSWPLQVKGQTTVWFIPFCSCHTNQQVISIHFLKKKKYSRQSVQIVAVCTGNMLFSLNLFYTVLNK